MRVPPRPSPTREKEEGLLKSLSFIFLSLYLSSFVSFSNFFHAFLFFRGAPVTPYAQECLSGGPGQRGSHPRGCPPSRQPGGSAFGPRVVAWSSQSRSSKPWRVHACREQRGVSSRSPKESRQTNETNNRIIDTKQHRSNATIKLHHPRSENKQTINKQNKHGNNATSYRRNEKKTITKQINIWFLKTKKPYHLSRQTEQPKQTPRQ